MFMLLIKITIAKLLKLMSGDIDRWRIVKDFERMKNQNLLAGGCYEITSRSAFSAQYHQHRQSITSEVMLTGSDSKHQENLMLCTDKRKGKEK